MTPSTRRRIIERLYALADGAEPMSWPDIGFVARTNGLCEDIGLYFDPEAEDLAVNNQAYEFMRRTIDRLFDTQTYVFPSGDWGPERRTLAGLLAAIIEAGDE